jgi:hypothetical protein
MDMTGYISRIIATSGVTLGDVTLDPPGIAIAIDAIYRRVTL